MSGKRRAAVADLAVLVGVLLLVLVTPLAALVAAAQPIPPDTELTARALPGDRSTATLRPLPGGLPAGLRPDGLAALRPAAISALGVDGAGALERLLSADQSLQETAVREDDDVVYPYRYPAMTRLLDSAPRRGRTEAAGRLGAALMLFAGRNPDEFGARVSAAAAAFAVLDRARADGGCTAQTDLLLLLTADGQPRDRPVELEAERAVVACPHDPAPLWLLAQYLSQRATRAALLFDMGDAIRFDAQRRADAAAARLSAGYPGSAVAILATADNDLRAGVRATTAQPFAARQRLRAAAEGYLTALPFDAENASAGLARALIALGEPDRAAETVRAWTPRTPTPGPLLEILTVANESAHHFDRAESAARTLADRGQGAYPAGPLLFPVPGHQDEGTDQPPHGPQSTGTSSHLPFTIELQSIPGGAGGDVDDLAFIPAYRPGPLVGHNPGCAGLSWRRNALLARHAPAALAGLPTDQVALENLGRHCDLRGPDIRDIGRLETGQPIDPARLEWVADSRQNLFRWSGDLPRAEQAVRSWIVDADAGQALPWRRLGEVLFLQARFDEAVTAFNAAARRNRATHGDDDLGTWRMQLCAGAALLRTSRSAEGLALLRTVAGSAEYGSVYRRQLRGATGADRQASLEFAVVAYHARGQLADAERRAGQLWAALDHYSAARELLPHIDLGDPSVLLRERIDANQSLAEIGLGRLDAAAQSAARALQADPANPAFLMNAGFAADRAGRYEAAARFDTAALASDPGAYPAANDLGVALTHLGRRDEAVTALRRAVGARPGYALGWFNLGVVHGQMGPAHFLQSQGALARAFALDEKLRDAPRRPATDTATYTTSLDLSKPLPPRWSLAGLPALSPAPAAGLLAVLVLALMLARTAGAPGHAQQWLESLGARADRRLPHPAWAVATTALIFAFGAVRNRSPLAEILGLTAGVLLLSAVALRSRRYAARRSGAAIVQTSWTPGIAFGVVTAALAPWAPLPVTRPASTVARVHAAAPVTLALIGLVLFVEAAAFPAPIARGLATTAIVMVASVLVPVAPLDGAEINRNGVLAGAGLLGAAVLLGLAVV
ncbi:tetratricopeptide repeat protein [Actinoplanes sp. LDG1-06]|uniref:Tetratricopeptide repeat protein n=1 Tax=Paractinoplanes ovalisporus TaxID=2810368 RepID=A0ABS2AFR2_9ACTN|nr:tetratricopeptide repeat protein [Actinoplanes ovalisporus]MBM2618657.1 tetratricopeptide repeat protein [Actinoplanes ovalisporus]